MVDTRQIIRRARLSKPDVHERFSFAGIAPGRRLVAGAALAETLPDTTGDR
jgi:hypothetical protein